MSRVLLAPLVAALCTAGGAHPPARGPQAAHGPQASPPRASAPDDVARPPPVDTAGSTAAPTSALTQADACPGEVEIANGYQDDDGCPDVVPAELAAILGVVDGVTFDIDKEHIRVDASRAALDRLVEVLGRHPGVSIEVSVHEDDRRDGQTYGRCLSCRRADAVAHYLIAHGIDRARVVARGYGPDRPIASNKTAAGRRQNRRIEVHLLNPDGRPIPTPLPPPPPEKLDAGCVDRHTARRGRGEPRDCYPYVCRAGACLTRCDDRRDCAGAQDPSEFAAQGWPLECMPSGQCTPMDPEKVQ